MKSERAYCWPRALLATVLCAYVAVAARDDFADRFRLAPNNTQAVVGSNVTLQCAFFPSDGPVDVVWSKNDVIITDDADGLRIEEFYAVRYSLVGDRSLFEYHLHIRDVDLEDDAKYTCQRPPTSVGAKALIESAYLTVLVPSTPPTINDYPNGSIVTIDPASHATVNFTCECRDGKPKADIEWSLNSVALHESSEYDPQINNVFELNPETPSLQTARSELELASEQLRQGDRLSCTCSNPAMNAASTFLQFNVLSPPSSPTIESSHQEGSVLADTAITLRCRAQVGNPPGNMIWQRTYPNRSAPAIVKYSFNNVNGSLVNEISLVALPNDTGSIFHCIVQNEVTKTPLVASHHLNVLFGPATINVSGKLYAKFGEQIHVSCVSGPSNPIAIASWDCPNQKLTQHNSTEGNIRSAFGYISVANMTITLPTRNSVAACSCTMRNPATGTAVVRFVNLTSANAPNQVAIYKSTTENVLLENTTVQFVCIAAGSFPPAKLTWFVGNARYETETHRASLDIVMSNLTIALRREDNKHAFRCEATNLATDTPVSASVTVTVYYPPRSVQVTHEPHVIREGNDVTLMCEAGSSNPTSDISWFRNDEQVYSTSTVDIADQYGGWQKRSVLQFTAKEQDDGSSWKCVVSHEASDSEISNDKQIFVRHKPTFGPVNRTYLLTENQEWTVTVPLRSNPPASSIVWSHNNSQLHADTNLQLHGETMTISHVRRSMSGLYKLVVTNSEGMSSIEFYVDVLYQVSITHIANRTVDIGHSVSFECRYDGNPVYSNSVSWITASPRAADLKSRMETKRDSANRVVYLQISNVSWEDAGAFVCFGDNKVTNQPAATREALLIVRSPPRIEVRQRNLKVAARIGETVELSCTIRSFPCADVNWQKKVDYSYTVLSNSSEAVILTQEVNTAETAYRCTLHSRLRVTNVRNSSYGTYRCAARNQLNSQIHPRAALDVQLVEPTRPDTPMSFEVVNATANSLTLRWRAPFSGGFQQKFELRYYDMRNGVQQRPLYVADNNHLDYIYSIIEGLRPNTEYHISLISSNKLGDCDQQVTLVARTSDTFPMANDKIVTDNTRSFMFGMPVLIFAMIGVIVLFLLLLNIVLIIVCLRRKRTQLKVSSFATTPTRINNGNLTNGLHNVQFSPLVMDRAMSDEQFAAETLPPYGFSERNGTLTPFINGGTLTYHRTSDPSDLQNIALNDFTLKESNNIDLTNLRFTPNPAMDLPHPEMMEVLDAATPTGTYQLARSGPLDLVTITDNSTEMHENGSLLRSNGPPEVHQTRLNGNATHYRTCSKKDSPKHYVTFDTASHGTPSSTIQRNNTKNAAPANYVPVIYKPQNYQRNVCNGSDRQRTSVGSPLHWAEEAEI